MPTKPKQEAAPDDGLVAVTYPGPFDAVEIQVGYQWKVVKEGETVRVSPDVAMNLKQQGWTVPDVSTEAMIEDLQAQGAGLHKDHPDFEAYSASQGPVAEPKAAAPAADTIEDTGGDE